MYLKKIIIIIKNKVFIYIISVFDILIFTISQYLNIPNQQLSCNTKFK